MREIAPPLYEGWRQPDAAMFASSWLRKVSNTCSSHGQHPVTTAAGSLGWRVAPEQVGVGFVHLDKLGKIIDAEACEGRYRLVIGAEDGETTVFRIHFVAGSRLTYPRSRRAFWRHGR